MTAVKMQESDKAKMIRATALNLVGVVPLCCCQGPNLYHMLQSYVFDSYSV